jgi:hypothetical protein
MVKTCDMNRKEKIRKIADQILQNVGKTGSTGLYNGKAGLSLSLFMAAEYLQDEHIEDTAYRLFQESLVIQKNDAGFENGLSGIGYALLYLLENGYVEADFDEILGIQYKVIIQSFENIEKDPLRLLNSMQVIYFLSKVSGIKKEDNRIQEIITKIFEGVELFLAVQFHDFVDIHYANRKADVLNIFATYLKLVDYSGYIHFSRLLLENYAALYRKNRIVSSVESGFYLGKIVEKHNITGYEDIINENINHGINNILTSPLSLKEKIDFAKITDGIKQKEVKSDDILSGIENLNIDAVIQDLLKTGDEKFFPFGYGSGLGRLLIYYINKQTELL